MPRINSSGSFLTFCSEDQVAMIADRMVTEVSTTEDGSLSFEDFERATRYYAEYDGDG